MKSISVTNARLAGGGDRVAWGAGLFALGGFADGCGLTAALSAAVPRRGGRAPAHDRGKVLTHGLMLPPADAAGHRDGDGLAERPLVARIDAAGCSPELAKSLRNRNIGYVVSARKTPGVEAAIRSALRDPSRWHDALMHPKQHRGRAQVADLTDLSDLSGWPTGTRLVVRREPRHPGAQRSLFPSDSFRY